MLPFLSLSRSIRKDRSSIFLSILNDSHVSQTPREHTRGNKAYSVYADTATAVSQLPRTAQHQQSACQPVTVTSSCLVTAHPVRTPGEPDRVAGCTAGRETDDVSTLKRLEKTGEAAAASECRMRR